ncbi:ABC transporter substrate-binding protein [bacterium]|nr:ABC transporter substrate-binding protein [bacterium]
MRARIMGASILAAAAGLGLASPARALVIVTDEWPPLEFSAPGGPRGLSVEVVQEILARQHSKVPIQMVPWARGLHLLKTQPDVLLFSVSGTPERKRNFTLLGPLAEYQTVFYARKDRHREVRTVDDARKVKRVGVYAGTVFMDFLLKHGFKNLDVSATPKIAAHKLLVGRIDLWLDADFSMPWLLNEIGHRPTELAPRVVVDRTGVYLAFSRGTSAATVHAWHTTLQAMRRDGTLARIHRKWLPGKTPPSHIELTGLAPGSPMPTHAEALGGS